MRQEGGGVKSVPEGSENDEKRCVASVPCGHTGTTGRVIQSHSDGLRPGGKVELCSLVLA